MSAARETIKINHEDTKNTKKEWKNLRSLRYFVVDFPQQST